MGKHYDDLEEFERKYLNPWSADRIEGEKPQTSDNIDENATKKPNFLDLSLKYQELAQKMAKRSHLARKTAHFRELYGKPGSAYSEYERDADLENILRELGRLNGLSSSIVLDSRGKRAIPDPNVAFKKKKGKKPNLLRWTDPNDIDLHED